MEFWNRCLSFCHRYLPNKYVLVILVFAVILLFVGEQSILRDVQRGKQIHEVKTQLSQTKQQIHECEATIRSLQSTDSLERFAREHYYMHTPNEDVYLVEE